jgi:hypothetical protein
MERNQGLKVNSGAQKEGKSLASFKWGTSHPFIGKVKIFPSCDQNRTLGDSTHKF